MMLCVSELLFVDFTCQTGCSEEDREPPLKLRKIPGLFGNRGLYCVSGNPVTELNRGMKLTSDGTGG